MKKFVISVIVVGWIGLWLSTDPHALDQGLGVIRALTGAVITPLTSCTVAQIGTAASVTATGRDALAWCDQEVTMTRADVVGFTWYKTPDRPADVLVCQYPIKGTTFLVRDRGTFFIVGSQLCAQFKAQYEALPK